MEVAYIQVSGTQAIASRIQNIPAGIVGAVVRMSYADDPWCGLCKNVVFRHEGKSVTVMNAGKIVTVPPELIAAPSKEPVLVGVCGVDANETVLIPTLWAKISPVFHSADLSGDPAADPSLPIWAQLQQADAQIIQKVDNAKAAADNALAAADNATAAANAASTAAGSAAQAAQAAQNTANRGVQSAAAAAQAAATADGKAQAAGTAAGEAQATADGAIQAPISAAVGQTIVVKSIDGDGKPTEWEAVELPKEEVWEHICNIVPDGTTWAARQTFDNLYKKIKIMVSTGGNAIASSSNNTTRWKVTLYFNGGGDFRNFAIGFNTIGAYSGYYGIAEIINNTVQTVGFSNMANTILTSHAIAVGNYGINGIQIEANSTEMLLYTNTYKVYGVRL